MGGMGAFGASCDAAFTPTPSTRASSTAASGDAPFARSEAEEVCELLATSARLGSVSNPTLTLTLTLTLTQARP